MTETGALSILLIGTNLFFLSRLRALAQAMGGNVVVAKDMEQAGQVMAQSRPHLVVIDLANLDHPDYQRLPQLLTACSHRLILAFGPHAQPHLLRKARSLGIPKVVPNSMLAQTFADMLRTASEQRAEGQGPEAI